MSAVTSDPGVIAIYPLMQAYAACCTHAGLPYTLAAIRQGAGRVGEAAVRGAYGGEFVEAHRSEGLFE
jgi:hypothetical protein